MLPCCRCNCDISAAVLCLAAAQILIPAPHSRIPVCQFGGCCVAFLSLTPKPFWFLLSLALSTFVFSLGTLLPKLKNLQKIQQIHGGKHLHNLQTKGSEMDKCLPLAARFSHFRHKTATLLPSTSGGKPLWPSAAIAANTGKNPRTLFTFALFASFASLCLCVML
jgi:hypothetical protein